MRFLTVSQVRVVTWLPNNFSSMVMNTGPRDHREIKQASSAARRRGGHVSKSDILSPD
jgi:hypothetical protein